MLLQDNLEGLQHLAIPVTNLAVSQPFYEQLGFKELLKTEVKEDGDKIKVLFLKKDNLTLELFQLGPEKLKEIADRGDGHIDHVALNVRDIDSAFQEMTAAGFKPLQENAPVFLPFWKNGTRFFTVRGPDGEKIEFSQILK